MNIANLVRLLSWKHYLWSFASLPLPSVHCVTPSACFPRGATNRRTCINARTPLAAAPILRTATHNSIICVFAQTYSLILYRTHSLLNPFIRSCIHYINWLYNIWELWIDQCSNLNTIMNYIIDKYVKIWINLKYIYYVR